MTQFELLHPDDVRISLLFPGVRQDAFGRDYREGRLASGLPCYVDARDPRKFHATDGTFVANTRHVMVRDGDAVYRAGDIPVRAREVQERPRFPSKYYTRGPDGISRPVG